MDALDLEMQQKAREALDRADFNQEGAVTLLLNWIQGGHAGAGLARRLVDDYVRAIISEEARALDAR